MYYYIGNVGCTITGNGSGKKDSVAKYLIAVNSRVNVHVDRGGGVRDFYVR